MRALRALIPAAVLTLFALASHPSAAVAQVRMDRPAVAFPEDFGAILAVRELPDGRVLVADPLGKMLYAVDMDAGTRTQIGSEGQGPEEYLQPDAVWPLPGDSTLLIDLGNGRIVAMAPDLSFGPTAPIALGEPRPGTPLVLAIPQGVDGRGNLYTRSMGGGMGGEALPDSGTVLRIDRATRAAEPAGTFKVRERKRTVTGGANNQNVSISQVPLSPEDAWGVAPDGSIAMVRSNDYHLEWLHPDGTVTRGAPIDFESVRIGTAEKEEWVLASARTGGGISVSVSVDNGAMSMQFGRGGSGQRREIDQYEWPDRKPPFYGGTIPVDGRGRAWVRRHVDAGEPSTYDVFGQDGNHVQTVILPLGRQVLGFGTAGIYVVTFDEFDLTYLERYDMPTM